jgi:hypothetical protein
MLFFVGKFLPVFKGQFSKNEKKGDVMEAILSA